MQSLESHNQQQEFLQAPVLAIVGPTASGKTKTALALARHFDIEIINVDSGQVYRQMDIGTAKPTNDERQCVRHWLVDVRDPAETYSAAAFAADATAAIIDIRSRRRIPVLVGGTFFYLNALEQGLGDTPPVPDSVRDEWRERLALQGSQALHAHLRTVDPVTADRLHVNDAQRIVRALEVVTTTGATMPARPQAEDNVRVKKLALVPTRRSILHDAIKRRFVDMVNEGFVDEVRTLMNRSDLSAESTSMRSIGYRQAWAYLDGHFDENDMIERSIAATRQFAKRQLTWLRSMQGVVWFQSDSDGLEDSILDYLHASNLY